ncbi:MAG: iron complex outermembrane receptor protein [Candidatus Latescibacterota bacterium]|jgi:iron complex outermembrane receptor protein
MLTSFRTPHLLNKTWRLTAFLSLFIQGSYISGATAGVNDLLDLSLEDLARTPVSLVSLKAEDPLGLPAAVSVLTAKDLHNSNILNLADALRLVPGFHVGRIDANKWAASARGFNGRFANKVLVLIDGRSVYTPLASGVYWEMQDILLADLDRVEVIRGPGASLWGANAVNGIVNLVSKEAIATQGANLRIGTGSEEQLLLQGRYGGRINEQTYYRVYGHFGRRDDLKSKDDIAANDGWDSWKIGTRLDWRPAVRDHITLVTDLQQADIAQTALLFSPEAPYSHWMEDRIKSSNISTSWRWQRQVSDRSDFNLFSYYEHFERRGPPYGESYSIWNSEFQHRISLGNRHELLWGLGYRLTEVERTSETFAARVTPRKRLLSLSEGFAQDDISLVANRLRLILGAKLEHHEFTGWELQPNARLAWTPTPRHALWAATARAVQPSPSGLNSIHLLLNVLEPVEDSPPIFVGLVGNPNIRAETMYAFEIGYRYRHRDLLSLDVATFVNDYDNLISFEGIPPSVIFDEYILLAFTPGNLLSGRSYGVEVAGNYKWSNTWSLNTAYTFFHIELKLPASSNLISLDQEKAPNHIFTLTLQGLNLLGTDLNATLRRVSPLTVSTVNIPAYSELDLHVSRLVADQTSIALSLQNMLQSGHTEYTSRVVTFPLTQVQRAFTLTLVREF